MAQAAFDPVTLELLWTRLISATDEAAAALVRTSFSTLVRESYDFSCIVTDASGQSLVQATQSIPSFIGTLPATVKHFLRAYPIAKLQPGDVLITNDMYQGTGHLPDISLGKPLFHDGRMIGYAATTAHAPDIGGKIRSPEPREVFEEGLQIPIMKMIEAGTVNDTLVAIIRKNVRTPEQTLGDLWAQVVALDVMEARTLALLKDAGLTSLHELAAEIHGRCEAVMRAAIRNLPDGVYRTALDIDGQLDEPVHLEMAVTVAGDTLDIDFAGSSPQVDRAINSAMCFTFAQTVYGVKCMLAPSLPNNEGSFKPITVRAPEGSIVNPVFPASGGSRMLTGHFLGSMVLQALGAVVRDRVMAAPGSPHWGINQSGVRNGKPYANMLFFSGGLGANSRRDGVSCLGWPGNTAYTPVELSERIAPFRIKYKRLRPDSGGAGEFRGGLGQEILLENRSESPIAVSFLTEHIVYPARGIAGGKPGACGVLQINGQAAHAKRQHVIRKGDTILLAVPGGGGLGDPARRSRTRIENDLEQGYITDERPYRVSAKWP
ncbi:MAG: hydantoinase B/oxoprolinase family protein [Burkholderiales bacterium]|nr:hydantoinase B/oxoprolinase family protein [Burkholderiales bacterium]